MQGADDTGGREVGGKEDPASLHVSTHIHALARIGRRQPGAPPERRSGRAQRTLPTPRAGEDTVSALCGSTASVLSAFPRGRALVRQRASHFTGRSRHKHCLP